MKRLLPFLFLLTLFHAGVMPAQEKQRLPTKEEVKKILDDLKWKTGTIPVGSGMVTVNLQEGYRYLGPEDTRAVISKLWGNPPSTTWGLVFPPRSNPLQYPWAMLISGFEEEGYVKDEDADKLDPDKLLAEMQEGQKEANQQRVQQGYTALELKGWAMKPKYDKENKKLTWAIDLQEAGSTEHTVNYYVRILGRRGYLVLNLIAGLEDLSTIESTLPQTLAMVNFNEGQRYADFNSKTDKVAAYGIAGLIAAGVGLKLLKVGIFALFFKKIGIFFVAFWKLIVGGCAIVASWFKKMFRGKKATNPPPQ